MTKNEIARDLSILKSQKLVKSYSIDYEKCTEFEKILKHGYGYWIYTINFVDYNWNELEYTVWNNYKWNVKKDLYEYICFKAFNC